jgi:hypothetical protein
MCRKLEFRGGAGGGGAAGGGSQKIRVPTYLPTYLPSETGTHITLLYVTLLFRLLMLNAFRGIHTHHVSSLDKAT